jgi:hypothetical protein
MSRDENQDWSIEMVSTARDSEDWVTPMRSWKRASMESASEAKESSGMLVVKG